MPVHGRYLEHEYTLGPLVVRPLTPLVGAGLSGLDLRRPPDLQIIAALAEAVRRHAVVFCQAPGLEAREMVAFARTLGTLQEYAAVPAHAGLPEIHVFDYDASQRGREAFWHFDVLPTRRPARAGLLRAREVPAVGGDTLFCDLRAVYASLPTALARRLEGAVGLYDLVFERRLARFRGAGEAEAMALSDEPLQELPIVVTLPYGAPVAYVNPSFLVGIAGMARDEWLAVAAELRARVDRPEFQCRHRWRTDDVALWDNRACLHYATSNYWPCRRTMERVTLTDEMGASFLEHGLAAAATASEAATLQAAP